eukprot:GEZU01001192.1.p1 GENE.GEZU01001192.1~~GEZU01001192.1.p1  ORF type:complete len:146 (+),score=2.38 GEZU01001192.1:134-571(+)
MRCSLGITSSVASRMLATSIISLLFFLIQPIEARGILIGTIHNYNCSFFGESEFNSCDYNSQRDEPQLEGSRRIPRALSTLDNASGIWIDPIQFWEGVTVNSFQKRKLLLQAIGLLLKHLEIAGRAMQQRRDNSRRIKQLLASSS